MIDAVRSAGMTANDGRGTDRMRTGRDAHASGAASLKRDPHAIDHHVEIVGTRPGCGRPAKPRATRLSDLKFVLRIERERVAHHDAAPGAQGEAVHVVVLGDVAGHAIGGPVDPDRRIAEREPADPGGGSGIAFDERR